MQFSRLAVTAVIALSMAPAAPPALAVPFVPNSAVVAGDSGSLVEVGHRGKKYRKKYSKRYKYRRSCFGYGPWYGGCRSRYYARGYYPYYGYRHRGVSGCIRINGLLICF